MPWTIERRHEHIAIVTMYTNKVNAQNPAFFFDLHAAFDRRDAEFDDCAIVLTCTGATFSAALDFGHHFPLFARRLLTDPGSLRAHARRYRALKGREITWALPDIV